jgi:hypothetical protein
MKVREKLNMNRKREGRKQFVQNTVEILLVERE